MTNICSSFQNMLKNLFEQNHNQEPILVIDVNLRVRVLKKIYNDIGVIINKYLRSLVKLNSDAYGWQ